MPIPCTYCTVIENNRPYSRYHILRAELLPKLFHVFIFRDFLDHVQGFTNKFLLNNLQEFVLLQLFSGHIQGKVIRIYNSLDERQIFWHHLLKIVSDKNTAYIELNIVCFLSIIWEHVMRRCFRDKKNRAEGNFSLSNEVGSC